VGQGFLTPRTIRRAGVLAALGLVVAVVLGRPLVYDVEGVSMAPGLVPGDRVTSGPFPLLDRLRRPRRFDRWVLATADGAAAIKRVVGLPGERVSIAAGDLAIEGTTVLKGPRQLAEIGAPVTAGLPATTGSWSMAPREILDDFGIDAGRSVVLLPVRDVGFAAVVTVYGPSGCAVRARATVGRTVVTWRLPSGRFAIVAGRLDGHVVAVAWRLHGATTDRPGRSCLPPGPPDRWSAAAPWAEADPATDRSPPCALAIEPAGGATSAIERVDLWRDVFHRPAADGVTEWTLAADAVFTLGDHPAASRDSRHWGPVSLAALRHRVAAVVFADP
jgi:type IV secretory pathway protease TraF